MTLCSVHMPQTVVGKGLREGEKRGRGTKAQRHKVFLNENRPQANLSIHIIVFIIKLCAFFFSFSITQQMQFIKKTHYSILFQAVKARIVSGVKSFFILIRG